MFWDQIRLNEGNKDICCVSVIESHNLCRKQNKLITCLLSCPPLFIWPDRDFFQLWVFWGILSFSSFRFWFCLENSLFLTVHIKSYNLLQNSWLFNNKDVWLETLLLKCNWMAVMNAQNNSVHWFVHVFICSSIISSNFWNFDLINHVFQLDKISWVTFESAQFAKNKNKKKKHAISANFYFYCYSASPKPKAG